MGKDLFCLKGKSVVITGGTSYLGVAMVDCLAQYGADIYMLCRSKEKSLKLAEDLKQNYKNLICETIECDIGNRKSVENAIIHTLNISGKIDVLINNAAFYSDVMPFEKCSDENWLRGIDGTINSVRLMSQIVINQMLKQKKGSIINIGSMYGVVSPDMRIYGDSGENNPASYGAGKAAVIQLTRYLACTYGNNGIRVNAVSPGPFPQMEVQQNTDFINNLEKKNPMGRIGRPDDLKGIIVLLASDASSYINGQNIMVDGGWTVW